MIALAAFGALMVHAPIAEASSEVRILEALKECRSQKIR